MIEDLTLCKLIILYMLGRVDFAMTGAQISDFILGKEYMDYLVLSQAQGDLLETGLIAVSESQQSHNRTNLVITAEGRETLRYFGQRIPDAIVNDIEDYFRENAFEIRNELAIYGDYYRSTSGEYEAHLVAQEQDIKLLDLTLSVPTEELAEHICDTWQEKSEIVYKLITDQLF